MSGIKRGLNAKSKLESLAKMAKCDQQFASVSQIEAKKQDPKNTYFNTVYGNSSDIDILWEYETLRRVLPKNLLPNIRHDLLSKVRQHLKIFEVRERLERITNNSFHSKTDLSTPILDALSVLLGYSLVIICPPTSTCIYCGKQLTSHNDPVQVQLHTRLGTSIATKYEYRCRQCKNASQHIEENHGPPYDIRYSPTMFGNKKYGFKHYEDHFEVNIVKSTDVAYVEQIFVKQYFSEFHHGWLSSQAKTEAYNEANRGLPQEKHVKQFISLNPQIGERFKAKHVQRKEESSDEDENGIDNNEMNEENQSRMHELKRKTLSQAMINNEVKSELRERDLLGHTRFGPLKRHGEHISFKKSRYEFLKDTNEHRKTELYTHNVCYDGCKKRGCDKISTMDGLWKINHPICMWNCSSSYPIEITEFVPQVCPQEPEYGSAFCTVHRKIVASLGRPTALREFLKSCGSNPEKYNKEELSKVSSVLKSMSENTQTQNKTCGEEQGTEYLLRNKKLVHNKNLQTLGEEEDCRKDVGETVRLRRYSRGILAACSGGGHIWSFDSLYKSEGPTQVALLMIRYLQKRLKDIPPLEWDQHILNYDNMCNVCKLKLLQGPLPLEAPFNSIWQDVGKIIDPLHLKNHSKNKNCAELYNPDRVREEFPDANLMVCEQTFSWLGKFKKIINSMPKYHQLFMLHRLCKWRNNYTQYCYSENKKPILPSLKLKSGEQ